MGSQPVEQKYLLVFLAPQLLNLGCLRLPIPSSRLEDWMTSHQSSRPATTSWYHQETTTTETGQLRFRFPPDVFEMQGRGGRVHVDVRRHIINSSCDGGFWINQMLRLYDLHARNLQGQLPTHASAIIKGRHLWILAGLSEAGKTTAAELAEESGWIKLQDDLVFLKDGRYQASIDWADKKKEKSFDDTLVTGIVFLEQALEDKLIALPFKEAFSRAAAVWGPPQSFDMANWLAFLEREIKIIPSFRLRFRKSPGFARLLEEL